MICVMVNDITLTKTVFVWYLKQKRGKMNNPVRKAR
jgi:hypothetical protein